MGIAIVILSFNHPNHTQKCVESTLSHPIDPEDIILVHNGSEKKNVTQLKEWFPQIQHLEMPVNLGYSGGANAGLKVAFEKYHWALFLTNDTELLTFENKIPTNPALLALKIWLKNKRRLDSFGGQVDLTKAHLRHFREEETAINKFSRKQSVYVPGTAFMIHRDVFHALGGFDEKLHTYWEDVDFSLRAAAQGLTLGLAPQIEVGHKVGKTCHKDGFYTSYLFQRNRKIVCQRHLKGTHRKILLHANIWRSWGGLISKKIVQRRWQDVRLLLKAVN